MPVYQSQRHTLRTYGEVLQEVRYIVTSFVNLVILDAMMLENSVEPNTSIHQWLKNCQQVCQDWSDEYWKIQDTCLRGKEEIDADKNSLHCVLKNIASLFSNRGELLDQGIKFIQTNPGEDFKELVRKLSVLDHEISRYISDEYLELVGRVAQEETRENVTCPKCETSSHYCGSRFCESSRVPLQDRKIEHRYCCDNWNCRYEWYYFAVEKLGHNAACPKCGCQKVHYVGTGAYPLNDNPYQPQTYSDTEHYFRCADTSSRHEWLSLENWDANNQRST